MNKNENTVKINGRHYDSVTGELLHVENDADKPKATIGQATSEHSAKSKQKAVGLKRDIHPPVTPEKQSAPELPPSSPSMHDVVQRPMASIIHHKTEAPATLMRSAVRKPKSTEAHHLKAHGHTRPANVHPSHFIAPRMSVDLIDEQRLKRAEEVRRSRLISHYNLEAADQTTEQPHMISIASATPPRTVARRAPVRSRTTAQMLEEAVARATSHEQPPVRVNRSQRYGRHRGRIVGVSAVIIIGLGAAGFLLRQNMPGLQVQFASSKAGFSANLPTSSASDYSLATIGSSIDQVSLQYHTIAGSNHTYEIIERPSSWDSVTLRDEFVNQVTKQYDTVDAGGLIVYLYGQGNATWVNAGVWYTITSGGNLTSAALIQIATSL